MDVLDTEPKKTRIITCVSGDWHTQSELVASIARQSERFLFAGYVIVDVYNGDSFTLEIQNRDSELSEAFAIAGNGHIEQETLRRIRDHKCVLYLIGESGSVETVKKMLRATSVNSQLLSVATQKITNIKSG